MESGVLSKFTVHSSFDYGLRNMMNFYKKMSEKVNLPLKKHTLLVSHTESTTELLGPYRRFVIWVHGCCFDCEGCLAENTKNGTYTEMAVNALSEQILSGGAEGITVSGGEPFLQAEALSELILAVRKVKNIGVIVYSGFMLEELQEDEVCEKLLNVTDILIDGRYVKSLDDGRAYIGSANQRLHYLSERYKTVGQEYYAAVSRRAEIKFTKDQAILIGIPSAGVLDIWKKVKEKSGGSIGDF